MEALFGLAGVVVGSALTFLIGRDATRQQDVLAARLDLANLPPLIWPPSSYQALMTHLNVLRVRLNRIGIEESAFDELRNIAEECWRDANADYERGDPEPGIDAALLRSFEDNLIALDERAREPRWRREFRRGS